MRIKRDSPTALDHECAEYLRMKDALEALGKKLYRAARSLGVTPKDAAKSRFLAGSLYEVLATLSTRTEVDQAAAIAFNKRSPGVWSNAFKTEWVHSLRPDWERNTSSTYHRAVRACLRTKPVQRLTVRPRKSKASPSRGLGTQRKQAA